VIHAKHSGAPLRNGAPNDSDAEHGLTVRPGAGKLSSDARVVYEIVLRFIPPDGEPTGPKLARRGLGFELPPRRPGRCPRGKPAKLNADCARDPVGDPL
jgi:hypothetical protein